MSDFSTELHQPLVEVLEAVLQSILCDERMGLSERIRVATEVEMRLLWRLAAPAVALWQLKYFQGTLPTWSWLQLRLATLGSRSSHTASW
ncbi:hypothetical protein AMTR_s00062p00174040 [Amborella trichopoda]|uniref:Uncharacterized protein n=1 Tax=Amborella trichopoda TaxID=13333 RepID=U5DGW0_AMBTC|nr:hypothetical protein AMTR_s00062p00174040 [Amborella trichopoda]